MCWDRKGGTLWLNTPFKGQLQDFRGSKERQINTVTDINKGHNVKLLRVFCQEVEFRDTAPNSVELREAAASEIELKSKDLKKKKWLWYSFSSFKQLL